VLIDMQMTPYAIPLALTNPRDHIFDSELISRWKGNGSRVKPAISHHEDQQPCHRDHLLGDLWEACECQEEERKRFVHKNG
jgi:hypothetical protein